LINFNNNKIINNVKKENINLISESFSNNINISYLDKNLIQDVDNFILLYFKNIENTNVMHYEAIINKNINKYIYNLNNIPEYIKFLIFYNNYYFFNNTIRVNNQFSSIKNLTNLFEKYEDYFKNLNEEQKESIIEHIITNNDEIDDNISIKDIELIENESDISQSEDNDEIKSDLDYESLSEDNDEIKSDLGYESQSEDNDEIKSDLDYESQSEDNDEIKSDLGYESDDEKTLKQKGGLSNVEKIIESSKTDSKLSYYTTIELELALGEEVDEKEKNKIKCECQFERIREAYSNLFGYIYRPSERQIDYKLIEKLKQKEENKIGGNKTKNKRKNKRKNNKTLKYKIKIKK